MFSRRKGHVGKTAWNFALCSLFALLTFNLNYAEGKQHVFRDYEYLDSKGIYELSRELAKKYPEFLTLTSAQNRFGLRAAGTDADCPFEKDVIGCSNWILTIQDNVLYPPGSDESLALPEVLLSGALHGNERVGPTVVMEFAAMLLSAADCESYPRINQPDASEPGIVKEEYLEQKRRAKECHHELKEKGEKSDDRRWLARLVSTRRIVIVPTANSLGYFRNEMGEDGIDPNGDFPFSLPSKKTNVTCMQTIAARTMNELFRSHVFDILLNFHAGVSGIGYSWGTPFYVDKISPDATAQVEIAHAMSKFGGVSFWDKINMKSGQINEIAGTSRGIMEDWAYGGQWGQGTQVQCNSTNYGNYEGPKTAPIGINHRAMTFYIGTSSDIVPPVKHLGTDENRFSPSGHTKGSGHIARLMRMSLLATDIAKPYVSITRVGNLGVSDDIVPLRLPSKRSCMYTKSYQVPSNKDVTIEWDVGGALEVEDTMLVYGKWSDFPEDVDGFSQPLGLVEMITAKNNLLQQNNLNIVYFGSGHAKWSEDTSRFIMKITTDQFEKGDLIAVFAVAVVDKSWASQGEGDPWPPNQPPQSHLVNMRINPNYSKLHVGGQTHWFSTPLTLEIRNEGSKMKETSTRLPRVSKLQKLEEEIEEIEEDIAYELFTAKSAFFFATSLCLVGLAVTLYNNKKNRQGNSYGNLDDIKYYDDEGEFAELQLS